LFEILKGVLGFTLKILRSRAIFAPKMDATECKVSRLTLAIRKVQILKNKNVYLIGGCKYFSQHVINDSCTLGD
jgi:hypothetical protein